jgi:hypothetical protein
MELPTFTETISLVENHIATPLENFIYENEPAGNEDSYIFRSGLINLLNYVIKNIDEEIIENKEEAGFYLKNKVQ